MTIISASRRTDIPAYYGDWFMDKIRKGSCLVVNPFNGGVTQVPLGPADVDGIVFWSRDYRPMLEHLSQLHTLGYRFYFQFTITGAPREIDPGAPPAERACATAHELARAFGLVAVVWRYDPIVLTSHTDADWHIANFRQLARRLEGATDTCVISFLDFYRKLDWNFYPLLDRLGITLDQPEWDELRELAHAIAGVARDHGMRAAACCEPELNVDDAAPASCVDAARLGAIAAVDLSGLKTHPTRNGCRCASSRDIGAYDTCPTGCAYCYANHSRKTSAKRMRAIRASDPALNPAGVK